MIISVASGKGGTGKTLVATSLALALKEKYAVQLLDCDVEEPDVHIFLKPVTAGSETVSVPVPWINEAKCSHCGRCAEVCVYHAIVVLDEHTLTFPELCHSCGQVSEFLLLKVSANIDSGCSVCGSRNLEKLISAPALLKYNTTSSGTTCCGREERCDTPACSTGDLCRRH